MNAINDGIHQVFIDTWNSQPLAGNFENLIPQSLIEEFKPMMEPSKLKYHFRQKKNQKEKYPLNAKLR